MDTKRFSDFLFGNYEEAVAYFAANKKDEVLSNSGPEHAAVIFTNIFLTANRKVCLHARNVFSPYNPVAKDGTLIEAMKAFLDKDTCLQIVLEEYDMGNDYNILRDILRTYPPSKILLRINTKERIQICEEQVYLCIADETMYRIEYATGNRRARCNFNDPYAAKKFQRVFDKFFYSSETAWL